MTRHSRGKLRLGPAWTTPWWLALLVTALPAPLSAAPPQSLDYQRDIRPLLARYCTECHGGAKPQSDVNLAAIRTEAQVLADRRLWKRARDMLHSQEMPPEDHPQPSVAEYERLTDWIDAILRQPSLGGRRDPGHTPPRRLNRVEYNNSLIDLLGIRRQPNYYNPAQGMPENVRVLLFREQSPMLGDLPPDDIEYGFDNIAEVLTLPPILLEKYLAAAQEAVNLAEKNNRTYGVRLRGRLSQAEKSRAVVRQIASRAFRRPVAPDELDRLMVLYQRAVDGGETPANALKVPLQAILVSPHFLFRVEGLAPAKSTESVVPVTDYELATRMSYFLWSSLPDDELFDCAKNGTLRQPDVLEAQVRRMLASPKSKSLSENFALQWLQISNVVAAMPDMDTFPQFYRMAKYVPQAYRLEALLLFETVMVEDRSVLDLVGADFTWANATLARFYGLPVRENGAHNWYRYKLADERRGGVLTLSAVLLVTSNPTRTSPVKRGKWVLESILGTPPPPPLPDVADLDGPDKESEGLSLREKLEMHRSNPRCASCHKRMDPIGLGFENYDAIGIWRDKDGPHNIDARAELAAGEVFDGPVAFKRLVLEKRSHDFVRCLTEHLLTYALGRKLDYYDTPTVQEIVAATAKQDHKFSALVLEIVRSYPFQHRRNGEFADE